MNSELKNIDRKVTWYVRIAIALNAVAIGLVVLWLY